MTEPKKKAAIPVRPNNFKKLPASSSKFKITADWKAEEGLDYDIWVARVHVMSDGSKVVDILSWFFEQYNRPDLGTNSQGLPWQAFPELDVISHGDDRTGKESEARAKKGEEGYDEGLMLDLSKAPSTVVAYIPFITIYDEDDEGLTLGQGSQLSLVIEDLATKDRYATSPAETDASAVSFVPGAVKKNGSAWEFHGTQDEDKRGTTDDAWRVSNVLGANVPEPPLA